MSSEESIQQTPAGSAGSQLKSARERKNLAIADIANAQHLRVSVIQAIEDGQYEQIGSELFLKGYVRAYAEQVGLDPESVVAELDQELEPMRQQKAQAQENSPLITIEQRKRRKRRIARLVLLLLVLGGAGFAAYRLLLPGMGTVGEAPAEVSVEPEGDSLVDVAPAAMEEGATSPDLSANPNDESVISEGVVDSFPAPQAEGGAVTAEEAVEPEAVAEDEAVVAPAVPPAEDKPVAVAQVRLEATFVGDCWVLVTDGRGERLVSSLRQAGGSLNVSGQPPLKVVIGAVDAVGTIQFQGEEVDLSSFRVVNNRAEFTLR